MAMTGLAPSQRLGQSAREPAHMPLWRRLLHPSEAADSKFPKLVRGEGHQIDEINDRLNHLIALILRAYVLSWYPLISPRDRAFLPTLHSQGLIPILQPILTRLHDEPDRLLVFILLDLPTILTLHIEIYRASLEAVELDVGLEKQTLGDAYHARLPLLSVEKDDHGRYGVSPLYFTSLVDTLLRLYLPTEEYSSTVERIMAREILARVVLGTIARRASQSWFWWQIGLKLLGEPGKVDTKAGSQLDWPDVTRLAAVVLRWLSVIVKAISTMMMLLVQLVAILAVAPKVDMRYRRCWEPWMSVLGAVLVGGGGSVSQSRWYVRGIMLAIEGFLVVFSGLVDRLLPHLLLTRLLTPQHAIVAIAAFEKMLFPLDGYPGPAPPDPTVEEAVILRERLTSRTAELIAPMSSRTDRNLARARQQAVSVLSCLSDADCNTHGVASCLSALSACLVPELLGSRIDAEVGPP